MPVISDYTKPRSRREELMDNSGKARGGKMYPVACLAVYPSESAMLQQKVTVQLEPVAGQLVTNVTARVTCVGVPIRGIDAFVNSAADFPGNEEALRQALMNGTQIFPMEGETDISKHMNIVPRKVGGVNVIDSVARQAHNVAVNYLRRRKYTDAAQLTPSNTAITPSIIKYIVLDHFNGALDPDDHIDGAVSLEGTVPVRGIGIQQGGTAPTVNTTVKQTGVTNSIRAWKIDDTTTGGEAVLWVEEDANVANTPNIRVDFGLGDGQELSLQQFYLAEKVDGFTRAMRQLVDKYPEYGEDMIAKLVHGLTIDTGKMPYVLYEKDTYLNRGVKSAMDGPNLDYNETHTFGEISFSVPVSKTEFGMVVVTFLEVKPDEVISDQPHPMLTKPWGVHNHIADELALDPVPVTYRELDTNIAIGQEGTIAFYTGHNHMLRKYQRSAFIRGTDPATIEHKNALWQFALPLSVSPENILYPADISHAPFILTAPTDNAVSYRCLSQAMISSPMIMGPTPVERLAALEDPAILPNV